MFDSKVTGVGLGAGEIRHEGRFDPEITDDLSDYWLDDSFDDLVYRLTLDALEEGPEPPSRRALPDLGPIQAGPYLAAVLESVDRGTLNGFDMVEVLRARERLVSHFQAASMADAVEIAYCESGDSRSDANRLAEAAEFASDEIRAALTLTRRAAESRLGLAFDLVERLPSVWRLLRNGLIDLARARVIANGTSHLDGDQARAVIEGIERQATNLTTGQLGALIRRLCAQANPEAAAKRYEQGVEARRLWIEQTVDGTGSLHLLDIPVDTAAAIGRRVHQHMISLKNDGDTRAHDQLRADIACDLLLGAGEGVNGQGGMVDIHIDLTTLAGLDDRAAELAGIGPITAELARKIALSQDKAEWRFTVTDHERGIAHTGILRRRPNKPQIRQVHALHPTCVYPGCRVPARLCDLDHEIPWSQGGPTAVTKLTPKCRHDHRLRDHGWSYQYVDGSHVWISPLGHTYITSGQSP